MLTPHDSGQLEILIRRIESLAKLASETKVKITIDAEQTYFQPGIDYLILQLQKKYNREIPIIYNTYQCYLKDSYDRVVIDMKQAKNDKFWLGAKVVRGAYMIQERKRASEMGYDDSTDSRRNTSELSSSC
jgi:proline dehydrogenase